MGLPNAGVSVPDYLDRREGLHTEAGDGRLQLAGDRFGAIGRDP